jgi:uncharacterized protein (DUF488 family)
MAEETVLELGEGEKRAVLTIGHSTRPIGEFIDLLHGNGVTLLVDIRTVPRSRHNPQYNRDTMPGELAEAGIGYCHMAGLGGLRKALKDSPNKGWRNASFRGFADYMLTDGFDASLSELISLAGKERVAIMCAEAVPWRCHRSLIADALVVNGVTVNHIIGPSTPSPHEVTRFAQVENGRLTYPEVEQINSA